MLTSVIRTLHPGKKIAFAPLRVFPYAFVISRIEELVRSVIGFPDLNIAGANDADEWERSKNERSFIRMCAGENGKDQPREFSRIRKNEHIIFHCKR